MMSNQRLAARLNLQRLSIIRNIALGGQLLALFFFSKVSDIGLPVSTLAVLMAIYALIIAITWWRSFRQPPITQLEFFNHLLVDIAFFTALIYFSGGASNPFVSYYLVPISIAATTLPARYGWITALASLLAYSLLMNYQFPIPALSPHFPSAAMGGHHHDAGNNLHLLGMWANFALSAVLITYFVTRMARTVREQQALLNQQQEDALRNDQILAIGTLAAGTAHELGTPLNTMKVLIDDIVAEDPEDTDMKLLQQQVAQCRSTLQQLVATAETSDKDPQPKDLRCYFETMLERWQVMRPQLQAHITFEDALPELSAPFHPTVAQSLLNLLNNAADASPERVDVHVRWSTTEAIIAIEDHGPGIAPDIADRFGQPVMSEKPDGLGLGVFLAHTALERFGGSVTVLSPDHPGTLVEVKLPLAGGAQ